MRRNNPNQRAGAANSAGRKAPPQRATLAISLGCPAGIGPSVSLRAAAKTHARCVLIGDSKTIAAAARRHRIAARRLVAVDTAASIRALGDGAIGVWTPSTQLPRAVRLGHPTKAAGAAQLAWIDEACDLVSQGVCDGLVTAPVSKAVIASSGGRGSRLFRGHTEHLAKRLGAPEVVMAFQSDALTVALVTTHLALKRVPKALSVENVSNTCCQLVYLLERLDPKGRKRIAVASLNPHGGEDGLLGDEELTTIVPGIEDARKRLGKRATVSDPIGAETAFRCAVAGQFDAVVAMYHDQAVIPCKLLAFGEAVNVSLGLPIIRTSVDHGTAYDRAEAGDASDAAMLAASSLASRLAFPPGRGSASKNS